MKHKINLFICAYDWEISNTLTGDPLWVKADTQITRELKREIYNHIGNISGLFQLSIQIRNQTENKVNE